MFVLSMRCDLIMPSRRQRTEVELLEQLNGKESSTFMKVNFPVENSTQFYVSFKAEDTQEPDNSKIREWAPNDDANVKRLTHSQYGSDGAHSFFYRVGSTLASCSKLNKNTSSVRRRLRLEWAYDCRN